MRSFAAILLLALIAPSPAPSPLPTSQPTMQAKCDALFAKWEDRLNEEHFSSLIAPLFILTGDGDAQKLVGYRDHTVLAAARALHATYFDAPPTEPILILFFETEP